MSDNYISVIPEIPDFVPERDKELSSIAYLRSITPPGIEIDSSISDRIKLVDCGNNFQGISCPSCEANIDIETWQIWMEMDFEDEGFNLNLHEMKCCKNKHTLNDLIYHLPQGFARFILSAANTDIQLTPDQLEKFELILGCPVRVIYKQY
jgi:hypothetical protein